MVNKPSQPSTEESVNIPDDDVTEGYETDREAAQAIKELNPRQLDCIWSEFQFKEENWEKWDADYDDDAELWRDAKTGLWYDASCDEVFDTLRLFSAERGRIEAVDDYIGGEEWVKAYKGFDDKVSAKLPDLESSVENFMLPDDCSWSDIRQYMANASNKTEMGMCELQAANKIRDFVTWANTREDGELYYYMKGVYHNDDAEGRLEELITKKLIHEYSPTRYNNIEHQVRTYSKINEDRLGIDDGKVVVENGVIDILNQELHDHDESYYAIRKLPVKYDPDASEPEIFIEYLDSVVTTEGDKKKLQEFVGYTLYHWDIPFAKSLFLVGPTNSGKSTFVDIVKMLHDDDAVSNLTVQDLERRFQAADLEDSWLNARNEIDSDMMETVGKFKELIAGDEIKVEHKGVDPEKLQPQAKHMYAGNQVPSASVDDNAFYERIMLVSMPKTIPREEQDRQLLNKIEKELPGILNWALEGLERLLEQGHFTNDRPPEETEEMWQRWSSSVKMFIQDCLKVTGDHEEDFIPKEHVMEMFNIFCEEKGMPSASKRTMTEILTSETGVSHTKNGGTDGSGVYEGVASEGIGAELREYVAKNLNGEEVDREEISELF